MKLYELCHQIEREDSFVEFDKKEVSNVFKFFIVDTDSNLESKKFKAFSQRGLTLDDLSLLDAINPIINIPVFSEKLYLKIGDILSKDVIFYPCLVDGKHNYYICKVNTRCQLVDYNKSEYFELSSPEDEPVLFDPVYFSSTSEEFYIARDIKESTVFLVSELFRELIVENNLNVKLREI